MASEETHQDIASNLGLAPDCSIAGVDAAKSGWVVVRIGRSIEAFGAEDFEAVLALAEDCLVVGVDIPIGLPDVCRRGGRACDTDARKRLGSRSSTVFSPPPRAILDCEDYKQALARCRKTSPDGLGISIQSFNIMPRIREVDRLMTPELQKRVVEIHPELAFAVLHGEPLKLTKHEPEGRALRRKLLEDACGAGLPDRPGSVRATEDDLLDACAVALSAARIALGHAVTMPEEPEYDSRGLRLEINF